MLRSTLSDATIEDCAHYTQAIMLMVGVLSRYPSSEALSRTSTRDSQKMAAGKCISTLENMGTPST